MVCPLRRLRSSLARNGASVNHGLLLSAEALDLTATGIDNFFPAYISIFLLATFSVIRHTAVDCVLHGMQNNGGLRLLLVDNVAAFYWLDRDCKGRHAGAVQPINNV